MTDNHDFLDVQIKKPRASSLELLCLR